LGGKESSMQGTTRARITRPAKAGINAAIWIEPGRALVARGTVTPEDLVARLRRMPR
jgi:diaminopimelate decarboxylase